MSGRRQELNDLIRRQHELGLQQSEKAREEFVRVSVAILALARFLVDLSPTWRPDNPMPVRKNIETVEDLAEAKSRMASLEAGKGPGWLDEYRDLENQIRAVEGGILERAQRRAAV